ncbi:MAG TPA: F0F1 ATP synthase subunit epsilon [Afipia sp.]
MANTFHLDLVSPEKIVFSGEVEQVDVPGAEGDFGVLAGHSPLVATVRPGVMTVTVNGKHEKIIVLGGLAEVSEKGLTVLADTATSLAELDKIAFANQIAEMEENLKDEEPGNALDRAISRLDHFKVIQQQITSTGMH